MKVNCLLQNRRSQTDKYVKPQLFILHHSGGNCYSYQFLLPYLTPHFDVVVTELPGRGKRIMEPLITSRDAAVLDLAMLIRSQLNGQPFILYGHSMGAYFTPAIVDILSRGGKPPVGVVVSGTASPVVPEGMERHKMSQADLAAELRIMGGVPEEYFHSPELIEFFEPIVRADFQVVETPVPAEKIPVMGVPVHVMMGTEEYFTERIGEWKNFTKAECTTELMPGGHFFIHDHAPELAQRIKQCYDRYLVLRNG